MNSIVTALSIFSLIVSITSLNIVFSRYTAIKSNKNIVKSVCLWSKNSSWERDKELCQTIQDQTNTRFVYKEGKYVVESK